MSVGERDGFICRGRPASSIGETSRKDPQMGGCGYGRDVPKVLENCSKLKSKDISQKSIARGQEKT